MWLMVGLVVIIGGVVAWWYFVQQPQPSTMPTSESTLNNSSGAQETSESEYAFDEQYRTDSKIFSCRVRRYTESGCALFVSDISGINLHDTGVYIDYGSFDKKILPSPNGKYLLLVQEDKAILLDISSLAQKMVFQAPAGDTLGTYDAFPAFIPYVKWIDNNRIQISIFKQYTPEPYDNEPPATPFEVKTIQVG